MYFDQQTAADFLEDVLIYGMPLPKHLSDRSLNSKLNFDMNPEELEIKKETSTSSANSVTSTKIVDGKYPSYTPTSE